MRKSAKLYTFHGQSVAVIKVSAIETKADKPRSLGQAVFSHSLHSLHSLQQNTLLQPNIKTPHTIAPKTTPRIIKTLTFSKFGDKFRRVLPSLGGLRFLVEAARFGSVVSRERACQALGLLRVRRCARHRLVELGVIPVLVDLFRVGDSTTKLVSSNSLGVISTHARTALGQGTRGAHFAQGFRKSQDRVWAHVDYIRLVAEAGIIPLYAVLLQGPDFFEALCAIPILVNLFSDGNVEVRERVSGAIAKLSYDEADRVALADAGAVPLMIDVLHVLHDESEEAEELRDITKEADINFSEDPSLRERISVAIDDLTEDGNDKTKCF
ncbi:hypothetical protein Dsin_023329 [Dipteronia sinensis]|uniref:ARM repeat superfamily protein n=1 Tax=Dipteronia sinensis TaxID=43782 RepID=A0AAE0E0Y1_9ROSI|nr:hypothetical protein Dsin_023329 [Dipteronia sinensis]